MRALALVALALLATAPGGAQALVLVPLDSGTAVRLQLAAGPRVTGRLLAPFGEDSTRFLYCPSLRTPCTDAAHAPRVTPAPEVTRVEMQRGTHARRGAFLGAGIALGVAAGACILVEQLGCDPSEGAFFSYVALPVGFLGAGIGAVIGSSVPRWAVAP